MELNPDVSDRLTGTILQWGDESIATEVLARVARRPISVILCSDLLYGDGGWGGRGVQKQDEGNVEVGGGGKAGGGGAADLLAVTLGAVCSVSSRSSGDGEVIVLCCHERRFSGDKGAYFFEIIRQRGFEVVANVRLAGIDERYTDDCGISLTRIRRKRPGVPSVPLVAT